MKNKIYTTVILALSTLLFIACNKDDGDITTDPSINDNTESIPWTPNNDTLETAIPDYLTNAEAAKSFDMYQSYLDLGAQRYGKTPLEKQMNYLRNEWNKIPGNGAYKEFETAKNSAYDNQPIFSKRPVLFNQTNYEEGENIGELSKEFLTHSLLFYNFINASLGLPKVYISKYKQIRAQAGTWSIMKGLGGNHTPAEEEANQKQFPALLYNYARHSRQYGNLLLSDKYTVQTGLPSDENMTSEKYNLLLGSIWGEGEGEIIKGLGHRIAFMHNNKHIGLGFIPLQSVYMVWSDNTDKTLIDHYNDYYDVVGARDSRGITSAYPSEIFPYRLFMMDYGTSSSINNLPGSSHQSWSINLNKNFYSIPKTATLTLEMSLYESTDLVNWTQYQETKTYSSKIADRTNEPALYLNNGTTGGDYFAPKTEKRMIFRPPLEWHIYSIEKLNNSSVGNPVYFQYRFKIKDVPNTDPNNLGGANAFEYRTTLFRLADDL